MASVMLTASIWIGFWFSLLAIGTFVVRSRPSSKQLIAMRCNVLIRSVDRRLVVLWREVQPSSSIRFDREMEIKVGG